MRHKTKDKINQQTQETNTTMQSAATNQLRYFYSAAVCFWYIL